MSKIVKIFFGITIITMMVMFTLIWFWKNEAFSIRAAKIQGNRFVTKEEIFELAGIDFSKDIFEVNTGEIEQRVLSHPMIEKASVSRFLPSAIKIKVKERDLIAVLTGSEISAVDVAGTIISQFPPASVYDLPVITGFHLQTDSSGTRGYNHPELIQLSIDMLKDIKSYNLILYYEISELHYDRYVGFIVYLKKNNVPVVLGFDDYFRKMQYFLKIYDHLLDLNKLEQTKAIDLRFKDQVVVKNRI